MWPRSVLWTVFAIIMAVQVSGGPEPMEKPVAAADNSSNRLAVVPASADIVTIPLRTFKGQMAGVNSVAFSPDGKIILTGSSDSTAVLWDVASGRALQTFSGHPFDVFSVAFSPDGKTILTGGADQTAALWDVASGAKLRTFNFIGVRIFRNSHSYLDAVNSVAFAPNGKAILTGSADNTAKLWDISA